MNAINTVCFLDLEGVPDESTPDRLLPEHLRGGSNERKMRFLKEELSRTVQTRLTPMQRNYVVMHYWQGMRNSDIAHALGVGCPQVTKGLRAALKALRAHLEGFLGLYERLEREFLNDY